MNKDCPCNDIDKISANPIFLLKDDTMTEAALFQEFKNDWTKANLVIISNFKK